MTALIKSAQAQNIRGFGAMGDLVVARSAPNEKPEITLLKTEIARLQALLSTRDEEAQALTRAVEDARLKGEAEGRRIALDEFDNNRAEALECLEVGLAKALEHFSQRLIAMDRLSILMAKTCLEKLLLDDPHYHDICKAVISAQVKKLDAESIIEVQVSSADFPDEAELTQLADICGIDQGKISQSSALSAGDCRIRLVLGEMEIGIGQQWHQLSGLLDHLAGEGAN